MSRRHDITLSYGMRVLIGLLAGGSAAAAGYVVTGTSTGGLLGLAAAMIVLNVAILAWGGRPSQGTRPRTGLLAGVVVVIMAVSAAAVVGSSIDVSSDSASGGCDETGDVEVVEDATTPASAEGEHRLDQIVLTDVRVVESAGCTFDVTARATLEGGEPRYEPWFEVAVFDGDEAVADGYAVLHLPTGDTSWEPGETVDLDFWSDDPYAPWDQVAFADNGES